MERCSFLPPPDLQPLVERFWSWKSAPGEVVPMPLLPPGVGAEIVVHFGRPFVVAGDNGPVTLPPVHLMRPRSTPLDLAPQTDVDFIATRIRAGAIRHFLPIAMTELPDGSPDGVDIWGHEAARLRERIGEAAGRRARAAVFAHWLRHRAARWHAPDDAIDVALASLYSDPDASLDRVISAANMGRRQFERRFKAATGQSPKRFQRLLRCYKLVRHETLDPAESYLPRALDLGYFDQAHAIHDIRDLTGRTPTALFGEMAARTHFYNRPGSASA